MKRKIITIDQDRCTGCGDCIPNCPEGAIQMIDGKARLISDRFCDGLGACLGHCPEGAITIEAREAEPYNERKVMANIIQAGPNTIKAHLEHLREHGETACLSEALQVLEEKGIDNPLENEKASSAAKPISGHGGCPGSRTMDFEAPRTDVPQRRGQQPGQLRQWPVQLHLVSPHAPYFQNADVLLAADCAAYALGGFHQDWLKDRRLAIACPKLDSGLEVYEDKLAALIDDAGINTLTVLVMQVPCCSGLLALAQRAAERASRKVPIKNVVAGLQGQILRDEWV